MPCDEALRFGIHPHLVRPDVEEIVDPAVAYRAVPEKMYIFGLNDVTTAFQTDRICSNMTQSGRRTKKRLPETFSGSLLNLVKTRLQYCFLENKKSEIG